MRTARATMGLFLAVCCVCVHADESDPQKVTIEGTLSREMAVGAESTGWVVQVDSETIIDGKPVSSIEVSDTRKPRQLDEFENKRVKIAGKVVYRHGVETETQPYIEVANIKAAKVSGSPAAVSAAPAAHTDQWLGRWNGPEGTYLQISKDGEQYVLEIRDLDGSKTFDGSREGSRIAFVRGGVKEFISSGDGRATGMKWLSAKKDCLLTKPGEGWCRD